MIDGVDLIFIAPPVALLAVAIAAGLWGLSKRGMRGAVTAVVRVLVYGGFALFALFLIWAGMYYAGKGH